MQKSFTLVRKTKNLYSRRHQILYCFISLFRSPSSREHYCLNIILFWSFIVWFFYIIGYIVHQLWINTLFFSFNKIPEHLRLEEHIELSHLHELMEMFDNHRPETRIMEGTSKYSPTKYEHREPGALNPEEFKETIAGVLGTRKYDDQLDKLFTKVSNCHITSRATTLACNVDKQTAYQRFWIANIMCKIDLTGYNG